MWIVFSWHFFFCFWFLTFFRWIFSPFFLFADKLNANDKISRSNSRTLIDNSSLTRVHSHTVNLTQNASSFVGCSEINAGDDEIRPKYEKASRKKRRKRRKKWNFLESPFFCVILLWRKGSLISRKLAVTLTSPAVRVTEQKSNLI